LYSKIEEAFWIDIKVKALSTDGQFLFLYLLTSHHKNMIGYYVMPKLYVAADLNWEIERVDKGFAELLQNGFVTYDNKTQVVFINNFLKFNSIDNPNQITGAIKALGLVPNNPLDPIFSDRLNALKTAMCKGKKDEFKTLYETLIETVAKRVNPTLTVTEAENIITTETELAVKLGFETLGRKLNKTEQDIVEDYLKRHPVELVKIALEETAKENMGMDYLIGIMRNFHIRGIKTEDDYWDYEFQRDKENGKV